MEIVKFDSWWEIFYDNSSRFLFFNKRKYEEYTVKNKIITRSFNGEDSFLEHDELGRIKYYFDGSSKIWYYYVGDSQQIINKKIISKNGEKIICYYNGVKITKEIRIREGIKTVFYYNEKPELVKIEKFKDGKKIATRYNKW